jgi:hypothetical protein
MKIQAAKSYHNAKRVYSNILENDRMSSARVEMLQAGLTTDYADTH